MSNQLEKLKNSIKKEYTKIFELNLMKSSGFIPVDKRQTDFFVIISKAKVANKDNIEKIVKEKFSDLTPKFIPVDDSDFQEILSSVAPVQPAPSQAAERAVDVGDNNPEPSAEEMLVGIGWLTREQLNECQKEAQEKQVPLDSIFYAKGYLTYERIVSYLKKKYNCNVVSKADIIVKIIIQDSWAD